jgi:phosphoglycerol transferase MdoB-like AlkP superfamily enzyme
MFLPFPINFMFISLEAVLLALSGLFIKNVGATYTGAVGGLLTALGSPGLGLFTFIALILYGILIDLTLYAFKIKGAPQGVNRNRLIAAIAVSTMLIGIITYSASVISPEYIFAQTGIPSFIIQRNWILDAMVVFMGPATGATAGYATAYLWNKYLKSIALTL